MFFSPNIFHPAFLARFLFAQFVWAGVVIARCTSPVMFFAQCVFRLVFVSPSVFFAWCVLRPECLSTFFFRLGLALAGGSFRPCLGPPVFISALFLFLPHSRSHSSGHRRTVRSVLRPLTRAFLVHNPKLRGAVP